MFNLVNRFRDPFPHIFLFLCVMIIAKVNQDIGRHSSPGPDGLAACVNTSKMLCSTFMDMYTEVARGEVHDSIAAMQEFCSQQLGDEIGCGPDCSRNKGFWSSMEHPWLLLTSCICTTLLDLLVYSITKERRALRAKRDEEWIMIKVAKVVNVGHRDPFRTKN